MTSNNIRTIHVWDTEYSADSVEWCPIPPYQTMFLCGTYSLVKDDEENEKDKTREREKDKTQERVGSILLFKKYREKLVLLQKTTMPAVLDIKWCPQKIEEKVITGIVNAIGEVLIFELNRDKLQFLTKCSLSESDGDFLALSLDWSKEIAGVISASDTKGNITTLKFSNEGLDVLKSWNGHSLEAWIVCFDSYNHNIIYTGGDDGKLKVWDVRSDDLTPTATSSFHSAGVTALNSNAFIENQLVSGSYDETVLLWDTRSFKSPVQSINGCGGIWRLKFEPSNRSRYLLSASIYGGFQIFDVIACEKVADYREHESLAYGADWCHLSEDEMHDFFKLDSMSLIATCSFYDHKLCVSMWHKEPVDL